MKSTGLFLLFLACSAFSLIPGELRVQDESGQMWALDSTWVDGARPYPKKLADREKWFQAKNGESWRGERFDGQFDKVISPGTWQWEDIIIPDGKRMYPTCKGVPVWMGSQALAFAPGGGDTVTDLYAACPFGFYWVDAQTKEIRYIGDTTRYVPDSVGCPGPFLNSDSIIDGLDGTFKMHQIFDRFGGWSSIDPITGRIYFSQKNTYNTSAYQDQILRYMEKLLPYNEAGGSQVLLPSYLDHHDLYKKFSGPHGGALTPVMVDGKRAAPRFQVKTISVRYRWLPFSGYGNTVMLSPDGHTTYLTDGTWPPKWSQVFGVNTRTGVKGARLSLINPAPIETWSSGGQTGFSSNFDNWLYGCRQWACCGGGPGYLYRVNSATGRWQMLYDSYSLWPVKSEHVGRDYYNELDCTYSGPADALTLGFTTTCFQSQCPRTGAIINGGWDGTGLVQYRDGFVTDWAVAHTSLIYSGRKEWAGQYVCDFTDFQTNLCVVPNGDIYITERIWKGSASDTLRKNGIRIMHFSRTNWPEEVPMNDYANQFITPVMRESLMVDYAVTQFGLNFTGAYEPDIFTRCRITVKRASDSTLIEGAQVDIKKTKWMASRWTELEGIVSLNLSQGTYNVTVTRAAFFPESLQALDMSTAALHEYTVYLKADTALLTASEQVEGETVFAPGFVVNPNPFTGSIHFTLQGKLIGASLRVYDLNGRLVADLSPRGVAVTGSKLNQGYRVRWNASAFPSGIYLVKAVIGGRVLNRKVTLLR